MGRPKVPHCKECRYLGGQPRGWYTQGRWKCRRCDRYIDGQEIRTSPRWCPFRFSSIVPVD